MSRWMMPFWCACWIAWQTCTKSASRAGMASCCLSQYSVIGTPSTNSIAKYGRPCCVAPASKKTATFETFTDKKVLTDGGRSIEIHQIAGGGHNDAFAMIYLPKEKILIEGDAFTPLAANAPVPAMPNPYAVNLHENIERLKLDVKQIAALHGPRLATMADLKTFIGQGAARGTN